MKNEISCKQTQTGFIFRISSCIGIRDELSVTVNSLAGYSQIDSKMTEVSYCKNAVSKFFSVACIMNQDTQSL